MPQAEQARRVQQHGGPHGGPCLLDPQGQVGRDKGVQLRQVQAPAGTRGWVRSEEEWCE